MTTRTVAAELAPRGVRMLDAPVARTREAAVSGTLSIMVGGLSIVLVEQNAQMALRLCHHAYVLENGRITLEGTGQQLFASEYVRRAYLGA